MPPRERAPRSDAPAATAWHTLAAADAARRLGAPPTGLSADEAAQRLAEHGPNEISAERQDPWWKLLLQQFRDPLIYILLVAAAVTLALRDYTDSVVILVVVLLNAAIGFVQEYRARAAMQALARMTALHAEVVRDGHTRPVASRELVPGDVVLLTSGVRVPADLRLTDVRALEVDESALTGESLAVGKTTAPIESETLVPGDQTNIAFAGTTVTRGRGRGLVVRTAAATELGRIATAMREVGVVATPLQRKMDRLGRQIGLVVLALSAVIVVVGLLRGLSAGEIFLTAVAMAVAAVPEGLPVVLTVTLAIGVRRMARRQAIIRSLPAVETLGSTTVVGSDKTGTLTKNEMTVRALWAGGRSYEATGTGYAPEGVVQDGAAPVRADDDPALRAMLLSAVLANEADAESLGTGTPHGDPTEIALHVVAAKAGLAPAEARRRHPELDVLPFESERRLMATLNAGAGEERRLHVKGAPEAVLGRCERMLGAAGEEPLDAARVREVVAQLAGRGLRVLAMAYRDARDTTVADEAALSQPLVLAGLVGMEDPVRPEAVTAVVDAHAAGIRVLMLTGDHVDTARAIGAQLGLGERALTGHELQSLNDEELARVLRDTNVFARVAPEHKLRIVQRLKQQGEIVAVTGDGVNDAPALRAAHLGVAMGATGTDVAREAADMVLADDNFATITAAVEEGRIVFANIRKVTFFLLSTAVGGVLTIIAALLIGWPLPFIAVQILWMNLVTNGLQDVALAFEPGEPGLLRRPPRAAGEGVLSRRLMARLGAVGLVIAAGTLGTFWWSWRQTGDLTLARTMALTQIVVFQFFHVFNSRSLDRSILRIPLLSNRVLFASILMAGAAHLLVLHVPALQAIFQTVALGVEQWLTVLLVGTLVILGGELDKWWNRRRDRPLG